MIYCNLSIVPVCTRYCHGMPSPGPHTLHPDSGQVLHQTGPLPGLNMAQTKLTPTRLSRLSRIIHLENLLKGENSYWKRCFVVLQTSFWILQLYISGIYLIESTCVLILSEQICKQILKLIIKVMHTSNNFMNLCVD